MAQQNPNLGEAEKGSWKIPMFILLAMAGGAAYYFYSRRKGDGAVSGEMSEKQLFKVMSEQEVRALPEADMVG